MPDSVCSIYKENTTGSLTSVNAGTATTIDCRNFSSGLIAIKNTGLANTLQYKIDGYANYSGAAAGIADVSLADIAPGATVTYSFTAQRAKRVITVTPKVGGSQSTYIVEYCLGL